MATGFGVRLGIVGLALGLGAATAGAEDAPPVRVNGEVGGVDGRVVTLRTEDGASARLELAQGARVFGMTGSSAAAIVPEAIVSAAGVAQPDGRLKASLVILFADDLPATGSGYLAWDATPDSTMVQGTVRTSAAGADGQVVSIYAPQAGSTVVVPPDAPVVALEPGDAGLLQPGAHVFVPAATRLPDGSLTAEMVTVGRDGFEPPM